MPLTYISVGVSRRGASSDVSSSGGGEGQPCCLARGPVHAPGRSSCPGGSAALGFDVDAGGGVTPPALLGATSKAYDPTAGRTPASESAGPRDASAGCLPPTLTQSANAGFP